jgi:hypothetical protein
MIKDCDHEEWIDSGMCLICSPPDGWQHHAVCIDHDPDACFPENDEPHLFAVAKKMCEECPVVGFCLEIGLEDKWGVWGGLDPIERQKLIRSGKVPTDRLEKRRFLRVYAYTS